MKLKDYSEKLDELAKKHPDVEIVYSSDDEGNSYSPVHFGPSLGIYTDNGFMPDDHTVEFKPNAVCLN